MIVGVKRLKFRIEVFSLKEKRQITRSLIQRIQNKYKISIAETANQNHLGILEVGLAIVSNDRLFIERKYDKILTFIESNYEIEMFEQIIEYIYF